MGKTSKSMILQLPQGLFFELLFNRWRTSPHTLLIRDILKNKEVDVAQFLFDVLRLRAANPDADVFVGILAGSGYTFAVMLFALYALKATAVPLSGIIDSHCHILRLCDTFLLAITPNLKSEGDKLSKRKNTPTFIFDTAIREYPVDLQFTRPRAASCMDHSLSHLARVGYVVFSTSGTSGPSKGVLNTRQSVEIGFLKRAEVLNVHSEKDTLLHFTPTYLATGLSSCVAGIISGA
ncbi:hypothetical protein BDW69DRAFT_183499 [Aspergillus filifer]